MDKATKSYESTVSLRGEQKLTLARKSFLSSLRGVNGDWLRKSFLTSLKRVNGDSCLIGDFHSPMQTQSALRTVLDSYPSHGSLTRPVVDPAGNS